MRIRLLFCFVLCLFIINTGFAQKYTPSRITFTGYPGATYAELLRASGLKPGTAISKKEMDAATLQLLNTGLFADVRFTFDGLNLRYVLRPADGLAPVFFENFPWWDDKTLTGLVESRTPLFHGSSIPDSGLQGQIAAALVALLEEKGVKATVTAAPRLDLGTGASLGTSFRIESPPVVVGEVKFSGLSLEWSAQVAPIQQAANGQPFNGATEATLSTAISDVYHHQGYLDVAMTGFQHGEVQVASDKIIVPVSATIHEGSQYRLAALTLSGDVLMTSDEFAKGTKIHPGDVANQELLRQTLALVAGPYKAKGYLRSTVRATPTFDTVQHTVNYDVTVVPGDVYHMGKLEIVNLDAEKKELFLKYLALHEGDAYDATYTPTFLAKNVKTLYKLEGLSAGYKQYEHEDTHVVDLVVTFQHGGPLEKVPAPF